MAYPILIDTISMTMYPTAVNCRISDTVDAFNSVLRSTPTNAEARGALARIQRDKKILEVPTKAADVRVGG
jgi:hypothetical protein